ncbi:hypothetical protein McanMca71_004002 [Microsporum canis]|uniref:Uncharacterized protein n=1 Tax=Arthroderma otae (strain ATCC MYA-4605 / CBS 113480) TaxID=554155 RepID=C5FRY9_ARTOC|nr:uncharacterized protein MCYG_05461 [Microsporum canis CBS 113480]EEQ32642.1 predicted protein [Microsporum canis CBS 113480]
MKVLNILSAALLAAVLPVAIAGPMPAYETDDIEQTPNKRFVAIPNLVPRGCSGGPRKLCWLEVCLDLFISVRRTRDSAPSRFPRILDKYVKKQADGQVESFYTHST